MVVRKGGNLMKVIDKINRKVVYRIYGDITLNGETGRVFLLQTQELDYVIDKIKRLKRDGVKNLEIKSRRLKSYYWD